MRYSYYVPNTVFSPSSMVSRAFSTLCVYSKASSSYPRLPLCQISFLSWPPLLSYPMEKNRVLNQSLTQLIWCLPGTKACASEQLSTMVSQVHIHIHGKPSRQLCTLDTGVIDSRPRSLVGWFHGIPISRQSASSCVCVDRQASQWWSRRLPPVDLTSLGQFHRMTHTHLITAC